MISSTRLARSHNQLKALPIKAINLKAKGKVLKRVVGPGKLIEPSKLAHIFISPIK
jgi:hypothetical protein